jgi:hypothetical protein
MLHAGYMVAILVIRDERHAVTNPAWHLEKRGIQRRGRIGANNSRQKQTRRRVRNGNLVAFSCNFRFAGHSLTELTVETITSLGEVLW